MSIIQALKTYIATYTGLDSGAPLWVDFLGAEPTGYAVISTPGPRIIERYVDGGSLRQYTFVLQTMERTADDLERLENLGFFEAFAEWLETQTNAGTLPDLGDGKIAEEIEATGWGYMFEQGQSQTGIYQIQCRLVYEQAAQEESL
jgi:hypothetical protein